MLFGADKKKSDITLEKMLGVQNILNKTTTRLYEILDRLTTNIH